MVSGIKSHNDSLSSKSFWCRYEMNSNNCWMMTMTWQIFTCQENWPVHPLLLVAPVFPIGWPPLQQLVQRYLGQAGQALLRSMGMRMTLKSLKCYLRSKRFTIPWATTDFYSTFWIFAYFLQAYFMQIDGTLNKLSTVCISLDTKCFFLFQWILLEIYFFGLLLSVVI